MKKITKVQYFSTIKKQIEKFLDDSYSIDSFYFALASGDIVIHAVFSKSDGYWDETPKIVQYDVRFHAKSIQKEYKVSGDWNNLLIKINERLSSFKWSRSYNGCNNSRSSVISKLQGCEGNHYVIVE